jgi:sarcosine oxidase
MVVGAGAFGSWTALWLRRRGHEVLLLDAHGPGNSLSSSGDEARVTRSGHAHDDFYPRWQRRSLDHWRAVGDQVGETLFVPTGMLWLAAHDEGPEADSLAVLERLRIPAERWTLERLEQAYPWIALDGLSWALHEPEAGALMARRGVAAVARRFVDEGGQLRRERVDPSELRTDRSRADLIVWACGPWLPGLFPGLLGPMISVTRQDVLYLATPPGDGRFDAGSAPTWVEHAAAIYGLPSIESRGFKIAPDAPGPAVDPDRLERTPSAERIAESRAYLRHRMPALAGQPLVESRVCQYETTADTHFVIDRHPELADTWIVGGGSGHGFKHAPAVGEYLAALIDDDGAATAELAPPDDRFRIGLRAPASGMRTAGHAAAPSASAKTR